MTDGPRRRTLLGMAAASAAFAAPSRAEGTRIDLEKAVYAPALTGAGGPVAWALLDDPTAPSGRKVLAQTSTDKTDHRFPLAIFDQPVTAEVDVAVRFKAVAGEVDRAAGIAVRLADKDNYYVVRANALEDNVRLYAVIDGDRRQFAGKGIKVASTQWHTLRLRAVGDRFTVYFDNELLFEATDRRITEPGRVALWTKADSLTEFVDLTIEALP